MKRYLKSIVIGLVLIAGVVYAGTWLQTDSTNRFYKISWNEYDVGGPGIAWNAYSDSIDNLYNKVWRDAPVNVKSDYGAVGDDGVTDNTAAFQAAIDTGKPVLVPEASGYYKVTSALTLLDNTHIFGFGKNSQIRQTTVGTDLFMASSKAGIIIENLYLYGTTGAARGIEFTTVTDSKIKDCIIYSHGDSADGSGIWLDTNSNDNEITGNKIDTSYYGIFIGGGSTRNVVEGNEVVDAVTAGIWLKTSTYNVVKGNIVHGSGLPGLYLREGANYNSITGNVSYSNDDSGIYIYDGNATDCIGNVVDGNTFYDNDPAEIFLRTVTNNVISNNTCMSSRGYGIYLTDAARKNTISGNLIKSSTNDGIKLFYDGVEYCRENIISENMIVSSGISGIALYNAYETMVTNNILVDNTDYGILVQGACDDSMVVDNLLKGNDGAIHINNSDDILISDNGIVSLSGGSSEYGIKITNAGSSGTVIQGNHFQITSNLISDSGTDTIVRNDNTGLVDETVTVVAPALQVWGATSIDSNSNAVDGTLGSGQYIGQIKTIVMIEASNLSTVTVANHDDIAGEPPNSGVPTGDGEVGTFDALDEVWVLIWTGTEWTTLRATCTFL